MPGSPELKPNKLNGSIVNFLYHIVFVRALKNLIGLLLVLWFLLLCFSGFCLVCVCQFPDFLFLFSFFWDWFLFTCLFYKEG